MASGDLDEYRVRDLVTAGAPIDAFGIGTQLATSADGPSMSTIYKLVEVEICGIKRYTAKYSDDKGSLPGSKQIFREKTRDILARSGECGTGEALLRPVILGGHVIEPLPSLDKTRRRIADAVAQLPDSLRSLEPADPWPVLHSRELRELIGQTRANLRG
jgi:nicotinate phosphoribosyltransferase